MINYGSYRSKLVKLQKEYPIYDREDDNQIIGYTSIGDMYVVTLENKKDDYYEGVLVSGKYAGVDTLALSSKDLNKSVFLFNEIDDFGKVSVCDKPVKYEYISSELEKNLPDIEK